MALILLSSCRYFLRGIIGIRLNKTGRPHQTPSLVSFFVWFRLGDWALTSCPSCAVPGSCVTPRNYTPWTVQTFPPSSVAECPNLSTPLCNNPSSATWSVSSEEAEMPGLWEEQCSFVSVGKEIFWNLSTEHLSSPCRRATSHYSTDRCHKRIGLCGRTPNTG